MTTITFIDASGQTTNVNISDGWTLMQGAITNGVEGILGECGGSCSCATCHCYVQESRAQELPPPSKNELEMLEHVAAPRQPNSRLACQIKISPELEGLCVELPEIQE